MCHYLVLFLIYSTRVLEIWIMGHSRSSEMVPFDKAHTSLYLSFIVTLVLSKFCIVFKIMRYIGRKSRYFILVFHITPPHITVANIFVLFFNNWVRSPWPIRWCRQILQYVICLLTAQARHRRTHRWKSELSSGAFR